MMAFEKNNGKGKVDAFAAKDSVNTEGIPKVLERLGGKGGEILKTEKNLYEICKDESLRKEIIDRLMKYASEAKREDFDRLKELEGILGADFAFLRTPPMPSEDYDGVYYSWGIGFLTSHPRYCSNVKRAHSVILNDLKSDKSLEAKLKGKVLEIGCGVGWLTDAIQKELGSDAWGVDINEFAISVGRFFGVKNLIHVPYVPRTFERYALPFDTNGFDAVLSYHPNFAWGNSSSRDTLAEVSRVLKRGGIFMEDYPTPSEIQNDEFAMYGLEYMSHHLGRWSFWVKK